MGTRSLQAAPGLPKAQAHSRPASPAPGPPTSPALLPRLLCSPPAPAACKRVLLPPTFPGSSLHPQPQPSQALNPSPLWFPPACGLQVTQQASLPTHLPCPQGPH